MKTFVRIAPHQFRFLLSEHWQYDTLIHRTLKDSSVYFRIENLEKVDGIFENVLVHAHIFMSFYS